MISYNDYVNTTLLNEAINQSKLNKDIILFFKIITSQKISSGGHDFEENFYEEANRFFKKI